VKEAQMPDFWFLLTTIAFFVLAIGYAAGCDKLSGGSNAV